jgi:hypothetical protein
MNKKVTGGILVTLGYLLSPLSWWNDLFLNIPIAYGVAFLFSLISKNLFAPAMIIAYWLTNITGFILMHKGAKKFIGSEEHKYNKDDFGKDICISILYTLVVVILILKGWLKPPF